MTRPPIKVVSCLDCLDPWTTFEYVEGRWIYNIVIFKTGEIDGRRKTSDTPKHRLGERISDDECKRIIQEYDLKFGAQS